MIAGVWGILEQYKGYRRIFLLVEIVAKFSLAILLGLLVSAPVHEFGHYMAGRITGAKLLHASWSSVRFVEEPSVIVFLAGPIMAIAFGWLMTRVGTRLSNNAVSPYIVAAGYVVILNNLVINLIPLFPMSDGTKALMKIMRSLAQP